jgi:hypothetical protein
MSWSYCRLLFFPFVLYTSIDRGLEQLGAYLIESPLGRRLSLAGSTFVTAFFCIVFVLVESSWAVRASTVGINLSATVSCSFRMDEPSKTDYLPLGHVGSAVRVRLTDFLPFIY